MKRYEKEIIDSLIGKGVLSQEVLDSAIKEAAKKDLRVTRYLAEKNLIDEGQVLEELSAITGVALVNLHDVEIDQSAVSAVPARFTWHYRLMPLSLEGGKLTVACSWPLSINVQDELRLMLGHRVETVLAKSDQITELLNRNYGLGSDTVGKMMEKEPDAGKREEEKAHVEDIEKLAGDASVIKLVNQIILEAYKKRATDIHIEPQRDKMRLRYRIDGVLQEQKIPDKVNRFIMPILSRIKVMSNLNIVERRLPQDGRAMVKTQDGMLDLRVSYIPTPHGESVVIRILATNMSYSLQKLGLNEKELELMCSFIRKPSGILFVTGPTGSGKTTTLYSCIKEVNDDNHKIITIEDPIEYEIDDVTQIQVNKTAGLTFANGLRSMLRHDPDIMMVGEVRDKETAEIAIRVALTGHLVFSTLHTNDAAGGVTRLLDIGIAPYLVSASVQAFIAQRLVRVLCPECKVKDENVDEGILSKIKRALDLPEDEELTVYASSGCQSCGKTGFKGRTAIYEMLTVTDNIRRLISENGSAEQIQKQAVKEGMRTLIQSGWEKVHKGLTTPSEVLKVCQDLQEPNLFKGVGPGTLSGGQGEEEQSPPGQSGKGSRAKDKGDPADRRVHKRLDISLPVEYKLIEKGDGDILKLDVSSAEEERTDERSFSEKLKAGYENLLTESSLLQTKVAEDNFKKDIYNGSASIICNISAGGMRFESRYRIPVGSVLDVVITVPGIKRKINCLAKVVRVEKNLPRGFLTAVSFLDTTGEDRRMIDDFVRKTFAEKMNFDIQE